MQQYDYLIVGSGLFGATFANLASRDGKRCLVIERRHTLGGNVYCENIGGINVHKYGAHIFHTSDRRVWDFVNSFVEFNRYTNSPVANYHGRLYNLPFNMNTFYQMWGVNTPGQAIGKIEEQRGRALERMRADGASEPRNLEEQARLLVGDDIFETLVKEYTEKQWGRECRDLPAFIIKRLPVRLTFDNNYFNDTYQGIPIGGYNKLVEGMLSQVDVTKDVDFLSDRIRWEASASKTVYTGQLDEFFGCRLGRLQWRSVRFETEVLHTPNYQGNAVVNYTSKDVPFTRIIEHKHFEMFGQRVYDVPDTVISREYSSEWREGMEPYYPVNDDRNNRLAAQYRELAAKERNVIFGGRLAEYRYYDMAPVILSAMQAYDREKGK